MLRLLASAGVPPHIALPSVELRGDPAVDFPYPFAGHRFIDGVAADALDENLLPTFAREIAAFMGAVHSIPVSFARASGIPEIDARTHGDGMRAWLDHGVEIARQLDGRDREVDRAVQWVARHPMPAELLDAPRVLIHADLVTEHVVVDPATGRIRGVIDWTDAMISDAPRDFVFLATWRGWQFVEEVLRHYPRETDSRFRARLHWMARTLAVMLLATAHERGTDLTPHIQAIRNVFAKDEIP